MHISRIMFMVSRSDWLLETVGKLFIISGWRKSTGHRTLETDELLLVKHEKSRSKTRFSIGVLRWIFRVTCQNVSVNITMGLTIRSLLILPLPNKVDGQVWTNSLTSLKASPLKQWLTSTRETPIALVINIPVPVFTHAGLRFLILRYRYRVVLTTKLGKFEQINSQVSKNEKRTGSLSLRHVKIRVLPSFPFSFLIRHDKQNYCLAASIFRSVKQSFFRKRLEVKSSLFFPTIC